MPTPAERKVLCEMGARLRARRVAVGISAEQLGHQTGLDRTYVTGVERGERNLGVVNLVRFATALDVDPGDLVTELRVGRKKASK